MKRKKGFYSISVVAKMFSVHQQTIRMYEKEGLISPKRTEGNTRQFSEEDVDRLEEVINLTHKMGVNLAGVQIILKLQKKVKRLQEDMNKVFEQMQGQLEDQSDDYKAVIKKDGEKLIGMKEDGAKSGVSLVDVKAEKSNIQNSNRNADNPDSEDTDNWEIEYEDD